MCVSAISAIQVQINEDKKTMNLSSSIAKEVLGKLEYLCPSEKGDSEGRTVTLEDRKSLKKLGLVKNQRNGRFCRTHAIIIREKYDANEYSLYGLYVSVSLR